MSLTHHHHFNSQLPIYWFPLITTIPKNKVHHLTFDVVADDDGGVGGGDDDYDDNVNDGDDGDDNDDDEYYNLSLGRWRKITREKRSMSGHTDYVVRFKC